MIYIGGDHAGFELKEEIKKYLVGLGFQIEDLGPHSFDPTDDYPDFVYSVAKNVAVKQDQGESDTFGIVFGGSGQGEAMTANKFRGIRAAVYYNGSLDIVKLSRAHNNANILSLGARFLTVEQAKEAVKLWLETEFEGGRHQRRMDKIAAIEK